MLLKAFLKGRRGWVIALGMNGLAVGAIEGGFVWLAKRAISGGFIWIAWMALLVSARTGLQILGARAELRLVASFLAERRADVLGWVSGRIAPVYREPLRGRLLALMTDGMDSLGQGVTSGFRCLSSAAQAAVLFPLLFSFSWKLALGAAMLGAPAILASRYRVRVLSLAGSRVERSRATSALETEEFGNALEGEIGNGRIDTAGGGWERSLRRRAGHAIAWEAHQAFFPPALEWFFFMALALLAALAATVGRVGGAGNLIPFGALLLLLYRPIREWARNYPAWLRALTAWSSQGNFEATLGEYPLRAAAPWRGGQDADVAAGAPVIIVQGLDFGYTHAAMAQPDRWIFRNLCLELKPEAVTWIRGRNGAGKSSLLKLLAQIEIPQAGCILLPDFLNDRKFPFAYLPQRANIGADFLVWADNYRMECPDDWDGLDSILGLRKILGRIPKLFAHGEPGILSGTVADTNSSGHTGFGASLSGGERQRLALARVFGSHAGYLLLDEPTTWLTASDRESLLGDLLAFWRRSPGHSSQVGAGSRSGALSGTSGEAAGAAPRMAPRGAAIVSHEPFLAEYCSESIELHPVSTLALELELEAQPKVVRDLE